MLLRNFITNRLCPSSLFGEISFCFLGGVADCFRRDRYFFNRIQNNIKNQLSALVAYPQIKEVAALRGKAEFFNESVALISAAKKSIFDWSSFFKQLNDLAGNQIVFDQILVQSLTTPIKIKGRADNEK